MGNSHRTDIAASLDQVESPIDPQVLGRTMTCELEHPTTSNRREVGVASRTMQQRGHCVHAPPAPNAAFKPRRVKPGEPAGQLICAAMEAALSRIRVADPGARRGEIEGIHRLRTSTRRLRSELR